MPNETDFCLLSQNEHDAKTEDELEASHNNDDASNSKLKFSDFCE